MIARTAGNAKDAIRFASRRAAMPQADRALKNYASRLLSKQVARDVERITTFLCDLVGRGTPPHLVKRCLELIGAAIDAATPSTTRTLGERLSIPELHQLETEAQWKREGAETQFMHEQSKANAIALLNADDEYEVARIAMRQRAVEIAAS